MASAMWGFDLGLGFATYLTYSGFLVLIMISLAAGSPAYGAILIGTYWLGRAAPVWVAPFLWRGHDIEELMDAMSANRLAYRRSVALALLFSAVAEGLSAWRLGANGL
jgi:hypothetical protein